MHDDVRLASFFFKFNRRDGPRSLAFVIRPDEPRGRDHFEVAAEERHRLRRGGDAEDEAVRSSRTGVDLAGIALTCGFRWTTTVKQAGELDKVVPILHTAEGPIVVVLKVSSDRDPLVLPPWDGTLLKSRFRQALLNKSRG